jgi:hypothetical protein
MRAVDENYGRKPFAKLLQVLRASTSEVIPRLQGAREQQQNVEDAIRRKPKGSLDKQEAFDRRNRSS